MTESKICTCPSGDGSLRWPCPKHPAVEQVGANVGHGHVFPRADGVKMRCGGPGLCSECAADASRARAALAHRSEFHQHLKECADEVATWPSYKREALTQPSPAQAEKAEVERPEVAEVAFVLRNIGAMDAEDIDGDNVDLRFEDAEGRDTGCDVSIVEYAEKAADLFEQHDRIVGALRAENAKLSEALDRWPLIRDSLKLRLADALARVEELERGKVYVEARRCDECQHGGINDSATGVAACHECDWAGPEPEEDKCPGCQRENCMAAACPQCGARYVLVASEEIAAPVAQAQQLHDLDKQCRDDVARALGLRPNEERGFAWSYLLASIKSCVKASEDAAQAQHSVPERLELTDDLKNILGRPNFTCTHLAQALRQIGFVIDRKAEAEQAACLHWMLNHYLANGANWKVHAEAELKAAAPGKEVGHE
ncbi:hypothetical protein ACM79O_27900 [Pseudomonas aeruginosa]|uniref:hypothetical protein n=1 Tax=Pseudomonas aeruginosa TaxID=287 RepID=UPI002880B8BC|nr:hypothetical protein [Pseudomonas aeruginosa]